jgi:hypothetical protein
VRPMESSARPQTTMISPLLVEEMERGRELCVFEVIGTARFADRDQTKEQPGPGPAATGVNGGKGEPDRHALRLGPPRKTRNPAPPLSPPTHYV